MYKKFIIGLLIVAVVNPIVGCYHFKSVLITDYEEFKNEESKSNEIFVQTKDGNWYHLLAQINI